MGLANVYFWCLLKTVFSEVLNKNEWLVVWDNVFARFNDPMFLYAICIAYNVYFGSSLVSLEREEDLSCFFRRQNAFNMKELISIAKNIASRYATEVQSSRFVPMKGKTYPVFVNYPKEGVVLHTIERERIRK